MCLLHKWNPIFKIKYYKGSEFGERTHWECKKCKTNKKELNFIERLILNFY